MEGKGIFKVMVLMMIAALVVTFVSLVNSGKEFSNNVNESSAGWDLEKMEAIKGDWTVVHFEYENKNCSSSAIELNLLLDLNSMPNVCDLYVDNRLDHIVELYDDYCGAECAGEVTNKLVYTKKVDPTIKHHVELCCEGSCLDNFLDPLC